MCSGEALHASPPRQLLRGCHCFEQRGSRAKIDRDRHECMADPTTRRWNVVFRTGEDTPRLQTRVRRQLVDVSDMTAKREYELPDVDGCSEQGVVERLVDRHPERRVDVR